MQNVITLHNVSTWFVVALIEAVLWAPTASALDQELLRGAWVNQYSGVVSPPYNRQDLQTFLDDDHLHHLGIFVEPAASGTFVGNPDIGQNGTLSGSAEAFASVAGRNLHIGASAGSTTEFVHPPNSETTSTGVAYAKDTVYGFANIRRGIEEFDKIERFSVTVEIDGETNIAGNGLVQLGAVLRLTDNQGNQSMDSDTWIYFDEGHHSFHNGAAESPLSFTLKGPLFHDTRDDPSFTFGTLELLLLVNAKTGFSGGTGQAMANFGNTMKISNIELFNAAGQVMPGVVVTGSLGTSYSYNVPEPKSVILLASSAIAMLCRRSLEAGSRGC